MTKKQILDYLSLKKQSEHSETEQASSGQREVPFSSLDKDKAHAESDTSEEEREMNKFLDKRIITTDRLKNMINIKVKYNAFYKLVERIKDCYVHSGSYTPKDAIKAYNEIKQSFEDMQYDKTIKDWCKRLEFPFAQSNTYSFQAVMDRRKKYTERVYQSLSSTATYDAPIASEKWSQASSSQAGVSSSLTATAKAFEQPAASSSQEASSSQPFTEMQPKQNKGKERDIGQDSKSIASLVLNKISLDTLGKLRRSLDNMTRQNASVYEDHNKLEKANKLISDTYDIYVYKKYQNITREKAVETMKSLIAGIKELPQSGTGTIRKEFLEFVANIEKGNPDPSGS